MDRSTVFAAWQSADTSRLAGSLGERIVFSSPVADYAGRARAGHLLTRIPRIMGQFELTGQWADDRRVVTAFAAPVPGGRVNGMLIEEQGADGLLAQVTLFLRPLALLRQGIGDIQELLAHDPLPES